MFRSTGAWAAFILLLAAEAIQATPSPASGKPAEPPRAELPARLYPSAPAGVAWDDLSAEAKGLAIAHETDHRDRGFGDSQAELTMVLRNRQGEESLRQLRVRTLEVQGDGDKSMVVFDAPPDVRGTALLTHSYATKPDDQWLYLPALRRVKRIASRNQSGPFMGSEFAYEDFAPQELEKYSYKYLRDENCAGRQCFVLERYPVDPYSGYTRQVLWVDQEEYRSWKVDFFDRKNDLLKTLTFDEYRQYLGRHWRAHEMEMVNHQTGKSTQLSWGDYQFGAGFTDRDFDQATLRRIR